MTNFLRYIVTSLSFITIWTIMLLAWEIHQTSDTGNRYQIINSANCVILLDKRTGLTWRNVWNNNKDKLPTSWELMDQYDEYTNVPIGEKLRRDEMIKRAKNFKKENEE